MNKPHISDLKLEMLAQGALSSAEERAVRAALEANPEAQSRYAEIAEGDAALLRAFPPDEVAAEVERRVRLHALADPRPTRSEWPRFGFPAMAWAACAAAICVAVLAFFAVGDRFDEVAPPGYRFKGEPALLVHRIEGKTAAKLTEQDTARAGDRIQLSIMGAEGRYAVVFSVDGNKNVTLHFPLNAKDGWIAAKGAPYSLPHSYELDDAPLFERFFLITAGAQIDTEAVLGRARAFAEGGAAAQPGGLLKGAVGGLPKDTRQSSFVLSKVQ